MSDECSEIQLLPQEAAERLIGFYPSITAADPRVYAAGLVAVFSIYKPHHLAKAVDPLVGLPSLYDFPPTMKQVREFLEPMAAREREMDERERRRQQQLLPAPKRNPEEEKYVMDGLRKLSDHLAKGFGPSVLDDDPPKKKKADA